MAGTEPRRVRMSDVFDKLNPAAIGLRFLPPPAVGGDAAPATPLIDTPSPSGALGGDVDIADGIMSGYVDHKQTREHLYKPTGKAGDVMADDEPFGKDFLDEFVDHIKKFQNLPIVRFLDLVFGVSRNDSNPLVQNNYNNLISVMNNAINSVKAEYNKREKQQNLEDEFNAPFRLQTGGRGVYTADEIARAHATTPGRGAGVGVAGGSSTRRSNISGNITRGSGRTGAQIFENLEQVALGAGNRNNTTTSAPPVQGIDVDEDVEYGGGADTNGSNADDASTGNRPITTVGLGAIPPVLQPQVFGVAELQTAFRTGKPAFLQWLMATGNVNNSTLQLAQMLFPPGIETSEFFSTVPFFSGFFMIDNVVRAAIVKVKDGILEIAQQERAPHINLIQPDNLIHIYTEEFAMAVGSAVLLNNEAIAPMARWKHYSESKEIKKYKSIIVNDILRHDRLFTKLKRTVQPIEQYVAQPLERISLMRQSLMSEIDDLSGYQTIPHRFHPYGQPPW